MKPQHRKVAFITNIIPHYRKSFYEKLCSCTHYEWMIFRGEKTENDGRPDYKGHINIPQSLVENQKIVIGPYTISWQKNLFSQLRVFSPNIIIVLGISGNFSTWMILLWAKIKGIKVVMWTCGWDPQSRRLSVLAFKNVFTRIFFSFPDIILAYSTKAQKYLVRLGVTTEKIMVCYNGIETDDLLRQENEITCKAVELRKTENVFNSVVLLYVGGMILEKRVDLLLDAFAVLSKNSENIYLWIVGDGPELLRYKKHAAELGLYKVKFWGQIVEDVDQFFAAADFFVLPGVGGLAFNQSMFWRTPCIATEADGTEDDLVIDGFTGKRFVSGDLSSLIAATKSCLELNESERKKWGENSRDLIVNRSNVDSMVQLFIKALDIF